jgi:hypothetical protein
MIPSNSRLIMQIAPGGVQRRFFGGVTPPAYESDEAGAQKMEQEQAAVGLEKPPLQYVDAASARSARLL